MDESLPYRVSYSDGEELCQKCQKEIRFGCLQIALMIQVRHSILARHRFANNLAEGWKPNLEFAVPHKHYT